MCMLKKLIIDTQRQTPLLFADQIHHSKWSSVNKHSPQSSSSQPCHQIWCGPSCHLHPCHDQKINLRLLPTHTGSAQSLGLTTTVALLLPLKDCIQAGGWGLGCKDCVVLLGHIFVFTKTNFSFTTIHYPNVDNFFLYLLSPH